MTEQLQYIEAARLYPHPNNPRKDLGDLTELADSIKANGVMQNLTVVPCAEKRGYTVIIGHRRLAAAKLAGLETVPCIVADLSENEQVSTMLLENMQRSDLTVYEQAQGFQMMMDMGETAETIAEKTGFSGSTVRRRLKLLELDPELFKKSAKRGATLEDYAKLGEIKDKDARDKVLASAGTNNFQRDLKAALDEQNAKEHLKEVEKQVKQWAEKTDAIDYSGYSYIRNYGTWNKKDSVQRPDDADTRKYVYRVGKYQIDIYAEHSDADKQKREAEEAAAEARRQSEQTERAAVKELDERCYALRRDFVAGVSGKTIKANLAAIVRTIALALMETGDFAFYNEDAGALCKLLCVDYDFDSRADESPFDENLMRTQIATSPELALLYTAFAMTGSGSYCSREWSTAKHRLVTRYTEDYQLDLCYEMLIALGYEMSDEERALKNGAHEIFETDSEEGDTE